MKKKYSIICMCLLLFLVIIFVAKNFSPIPNELGGITLPYKIPSTEITVLKAESFDGKYLEDGLDEEVEGLMTLLIQNEGEETIEYAHISMIGEQNQYDFEATVLEPGATMWVQEKEKQLYEEWYVEECTAEVAYAESVEDSSALVEVKENAEGELLVLNKTEEIIPCVRVFYKYYEEKSDVYLGGITYNVKINNLVPGKEQTIDAAHFEKGRSRVMMVRTYDEEQ